MAMIQGIQGETASKVRATNQWWAPAGLQQWRSTKGSPRAFAPEQNSEIAGKADEKIWKYMSNQENAGFSQIISMALHGESQN